MSKNISIADALEGNLDPIEFVVGCIIEDALNMAPEFLSDGTTDDAEQALNFAAEGLLEAVQQQLVDALGAAISARKAELLAKISVR